MYKGKIVTFLCLVYKCKQKIKQKHAFAIVSKKQPYIFVYSLMVRTKKKRSSWCFFLLLLIFLSHFPPSPCLMVYHHASATHTGNTKENLSDLFGFYIRTFVVCCVLLRSSLYISLYNTKRWRYIYIYFCG